MKKYLAKNFWTLKGWKSHLGLRLNGTNLSHFAIGNVTPEELLGEFVLPGLVNAHSHAFQRVMAGLAEQSSNRDDSFWTWRETMYRFAALIEPDELRVIAAQLYVEMLEAGYTSVCEFHYLHHQPDGTSYGDPAEMAMAIIEAARETGIRLTLLPVLYMRGGFDGRALTERQSRFAHSVQSFLELCMRLRGMENELMTTGIAIHSLRAVSAVALQEVLASERKQGRPIHIHIAEQNAEVEECVSVYGQRPVSWLLENAEIDRQWNLVHATHLEVGEITGIANSGATVVLCPTTEANLGDGLFPLKAYLDHGGEFAIGSDSHISVSPVEELRWLEYGQRLLSQKRIIATSDSQKSVGETLYGMAWKGGMCASGYTRPAIFDVEDKLLADLIVLDEDHPLLVGRDCRNVLDTWIFSGNQNLVRDVMVGGIWQVRGGRHRIREQIASRYRNTIRQLLMKL